MRSESTYRSKISKEDVALCEEQSGEKSTCGCAHGGKKSRSDDYGDGWCHPLVWGSVPALSLPPPGGVRLSAALGFCLLLLWVDQACPLTPLLRSPETHRVGPGTVGRAVLHVLHTLSP